MDRNTDDLVSLYFVPDQMKGLPHLDPERLGLVTAGDGAAVVVREHNNRHVL